MDQIRRFRHALLSVFVGQECGACGVKGRVAIGMVEVPAGIRWTIWYGKVWRTSNDFTFGSVQPSCVTLRPRASHD